MSDACPNAREQYRGALLYGALRMPTNREWCEAYDALAAKLQAAERDAARYRWLRAEDTSTDPRYYDFWQAFNFKLCRERQMDALIDAALASVEQRGQNAQSVTDSIDSPQPPP